MAVTPNAYVSNVSAQDDSDSTWNSSTISYLTLGAAISAASAGDIIAIASDHTETGGATLDYRGHAGTQTNPIIVISLDKDNSDVYRRMDNDTGKVATGAAAGANDWQSPADIIWIGFYLYVADNFLIGDEGDHRYIDGRIDVEDFLDAESSQSRNYLLFEDIDYYQITPGSLLYDSGSLDWYGGKYELGGSGAVNTALFNPGDGEGADITLIGVDLSAGPTTGDYLLNRTTTNRASVVKFIGCKLSANLAGFATGTRSGSNEKLIVHNCDDGNTIYQFHEEYGEGHIEEDVAIYLNATYDGTNGYSAEMVSNADAREFWRPLRFKLASFYSTANPTLTIELVLDDATALNDDDFWIEIEYPDSTIGADRKWDRSSRMANVQATPSALTSSSVTWTGTGGMTNEQKRKVEVTISGSQAGIFTVWACLAKPSLTVYTDPKVTVS